MAAEEFRQTRSPLRVTLDVWNALFMREVVARISQDRMGPVWLFLEPILHVAIMVGVRAMLGRTGRVVPGAEFIPWLLVGILTFFLFRNIMSRGMTAVNANQGLFAYRQVHPTDTVVVRFGLEFSLQSIVFILFILIAVFMGYTSLIPHNPLQGVNVWLSMAFFGLGIALIFSVFVATTPESQKFISLINLPLYMLSGVIFPVQVFPIEMRQYLMYNPLLHGVESMRMAVFSTYHSVPGIDLVYLQKSAIVLVLFGLMLHIRFKIAMIAK